MSIRETLNKKPILGYSIVPIALVFVVVGILRMKSGEPSAITTAYFSNDDGKTYFVDDSDKIPPFMKGGVEAYKAHVFRKPDGTLFVGYLEKVTPEAAAIIERVKKSKHGEDSVPMSAIAVVNAGHLYKRPGDAKWISATDRLAVNKLMTFPDADGKPLIEVEDE